ncbi:Uncharacterised protein [Acinetobacter baumannii]|nr:Uncharacterised protein [Acinetobacter baumannii]
MRGARHLLGEQRGQGSLLGECLVGGVAGVDQFLALGGRQRIEFAEAALAALHQGAQEGFDMPRRGVHGEVGVEHIAGVFEIHLRVAVPVELGDPDGQRVRVMGVGLRHGLDAGVRDRLGGGPAHVGKGGVEQWRGAAQQVAEGHLLVAQQRPGRLAQLRQEFVDGLFRRGADA